MASVQSLRLDNCLTLHIEGISKPTLNTIDESETEDEYTPPMTPTSDRLLEKFPKNLPGITKRRPSFLEAIVEE
ncbi:hypothetical protein DSO57_1017936 [Entomophthora muscae]|nr:hypothetical protein DSO57_1017936 [Entomophthora muscae]